LPSPAGKNAAILKGYTEQAVAAYVLLSETPAAPAAPSSAAALSSVSGAVTAPAAKTRASQRQNGLRVGTYAAVAKHL
jgi:hypothetical protein